ncbi:MAG: response regulator [Elusimicrobiota bacterium]|jgi:DNA-binding NtrC family response regulator
MSKIMVVHPDTGIAGRLSALLVGQKHEVRTFREGRPALEAFVAEKPEFILVNDVLPDTADHALFAEIMKVDPAAKVLVISVLEDQQEAEGLSRFGIRSFRPEEVVGVVDKLRKAAGQLKRPAEKTKPRIVAIDDDSAVTEMLESALTLTGYEVACAEDGLKGLALVKKVKPQLVLLDVAMPRMTGPETLKLIREFDPRVGVVMITGDSSFEMMEECRRYGAFDYLVKPFSIDYLLFCVYSRILLATI